MMSAGEREIFGVYWCTLFHGHINTSIHTHGHTLSFIPKDTPIQLPSVCCFLV